MRRASLIMAVAIAAAATLEAGMRFESTTRTTDDRGKDTQVMVVESWVDGDNARIEFRQAKGAAGVPDDGYLITNDGGRTMLLVDPDDETYMEWDIDAMFQLFSQVQQASAGMVSIDFRDTTADYVGASPGDDILGFSTTKHAMQMGYTMEMKVIGMKQRYTIHSDTESWVTSELTAPGFGSWLRKAPPKTGDPDLDLLLEGLTQKMEGVVLKSVTRSVMTDKKGRETRTTSTTAVTSIDEVEIDSGRFRVPPDYDKVEMPTGGETGDGESSGGLGGLFKKMG